MKKFPKCFAGCSYFPNASTVKFIDLPKLYVDTTCILKILENLETLLGVATYSLKNHRLGC